MWPDGIPGASPRDLGSHPSFLGTLTWAPFLFCRVTSLQHLGSGTKIRGVRASQPKYKGPCSFGKKTRDGGTWSDSARTPNLRTTTLMRPPRQRLPLGQLGATGHLPTDQTQSTSIYWTPAPGAEEAPSEVPPRTLLSRLSLVHGVDDGGTAVPVQLTREEVPGNSGACFRASCLWQSGD